MEDILKVLLHSHKDTWTLFSSFAIKPQIWKPLHKTWCYQVYIYPRSIEVTKDTTLLGGYFLSNYYIPHFHLPRTVSDKLASSVSPERQKYVAVSPICAGVNVSTLVGTVSCSKVISILLFSSTSSAGTEGLVCFNQTNSSSPETEPELLRHTRVTLSNSSTTFPGLASTLRVTKAGRSE